MSVHEGGGVLLEQVEGDMGVERTWPRLGRRLPALIVGALLSLVFLWLSVRKAPLAELQQAWMSARRGPMVGYGAILLVIQSIRAERWGILVRPLVTVRRELLHRITAAGCAALMLLPLRLGEFVRPLMLAQRTRVPSAQALTSVVVERLFDGLTIGLLMVLLLWGRADDASAASGRWAAGLVAVSFGGGLAGLVVAYRWRRPTLAVLRRWGDRVAPRHSGVILSRLEQFLAALDLLPSAGGVAGFLLWTALLWGAMAWGLHVLGLSFGLHLGMRRALEVLCWQTLGAMIPAAPGMVGTLAYFTVVGLGEAGAADPAGAVVFAQTAWALQWVQQVAMGLPVLASGRIWSAVLDGAGPTSTGDDPQPEGRPTS